MDGVAPVGVGATAPDRFGELTSGEFVKIIFTELANQDPLQPNDTGALLEQISTLRSIQSDVEMIDQLDSLVEQNQLASASGLIGHVVSGLTVHGERALDKVLSVSHTDEGPTLNLDNGARVRFGDVDEVFDGALLDDGEDDGDES